MTKHMKKTTLLIASSLLLLAATASAMGVSRKAKAVKRVDFLYVYQTPHAVLKHLTGLKYQLYFPNSNSKHQVLAFSDRPSRIAYRMNGAKWAKMIHLHAPADSPNIAITWANQGLLPQAYEVLSAKRDPRKVTYLLKRIGHRNDGYNDGKINTVVQRGQASVFVDGFTFGINSTTTVNLDPTFNNDPTQTVTVSGSGGESSSGSGTKVQCTYDAIKNACGTELHSIGQAAKYNACIGSLMADCLKAGEMS
jgi:hypothetical protein